jgi:hypothetical protein
LEISKQSCPEIRCVRMECSWLLLPVGRKRPRRTELEIFTVFTTSLKQTKLGPDQDVRHEPYIARRIANRIAESLLGEIAE